MKFVSNLLILIFSFNLYAAMPTNSADCTAQGFNWIEGQGCVVTQTTVDNRNRVEECKELTGPALESCIDRVSKEISSDATEHKRSFSKNEGLIYGAALVMTLATGWALIDAKSKSCSQPSYWLLLAGSVAALTGEIMARIKYEKLIKKAKENYEKLQIEENSSKEETVTHKQIAAFDKMIEIEKAREKAEGVRSTLYSISMASYAAATVSAILEMYPPLLANETGCAHSSITPQNEIKAIDVRSIASFDNHFKNYLFLDKISINEFIEISLRQLSDILIPSAHAGYEVPGLAVLGGGLIMLVKSSADVTKQFFMSQPLRAGLGVALSAAAVALKTQAKKNKETSIKRQAELAKMRDEFAATAGIMTGRCTTAMRKDSSNAPCYCYNEDGSKDLRKSTLKICNEIWGSGYSPIASNYDVTNSENDLTSTKTCVTKTFESDLGCKCAASKTCLQVVPNNLNFGASAAWTNGVFAASQDAYSSGLEGAALKEDSYVNQAATLKKKLDELAKKPELKETFKKANEIQGKLQASNMNIVREALKQGTLDSLIGFGTPSVQSTKDKKEDTKISKDKKSSSPQSVAGKQKRANFDLSFGEEQGSGIELTEEAKLDNSEYEYDAVLHTNPDHDIFKIISNRYLGTGVKKLFEEESK